MTVRSEMSPSADDAETGIVICMLWATRVIAAQCAHRLWACQALELEATLLSEAGSSRARALSSQRRAAAVRRRFGVSATIQARPKRRISLMIGSSARPFSVSSYSTRGGDSG